MNKKIDEEFRYIHDEYLLQCICTEQKDYIYNLNNIIDELEKDLEDKIYSIEPKGMHINYNCEYDSEEDYINGMIEQSRLCSLKENLYKLKELKKKGLI